MKCPMCKSRNQVEIDLHADGFSQDARECGACGAMWTFSGDTLKIIKKQASPQQKVCTDFVCPTCNSMVSYETDLTAFQFREELYECSVCRVSPAAKRKRSPATRTSWSARLTRCISTRPSSGL